MAEYLTKTCGGPCGRELPIAAFARRAAAGDGLQGYCRECMNEYGRDRTRQLPKRRRRQSKADMNRPKKRCPLCVGHKTAQLLHHDGSRDFVRCPKCRGKGWVWAETLTSSPS